MRLIETSTFYNNTSIISCSEAYTTKQCGQCGTLNNKIGKSETFECVKCKLVCDRDVHAARNILLRVTKQI